MNKTEQLTNHILECVYNEDGNQFNKASQAADHLMNEFDRVANRPYNLKKFPNVQDRFTDYLRGLPFNFLYMDFELTEFLDGLGINPKGKEFESDQLWQKYGALIYMRASRLSDKK